MSHPQQEQCSNQVRHLARTGHLRVVRLNGNCHYFTSEGGANILRAHYGIESGPLEGNLKQLFRDYDLGSTATYIPSANLKAVVGNFGMTDAMNGVTSFISPKPAQGPSPA